ncbi:neuroendocrine protein 7B2 isoform X2 [Agrilus planipennis]|uniref:Neuroendocrine protein 7B2 n=1 Tax=Agrilus planipennis TaxID=224129 RepID=A0A1W4X1A5_AGRPL|nr:neuroendocrine protein 7B2 isoform X2 [Agrilus planipennis]
MIILLLFCFSNGIWGYFPSGKEAMLSDLFLREVFNRMGKDMNENNNYYEFSDNLLGPLDARSLNRAVGDLEDEQLLPVNYNRLGSKGRIHPSLRDQEFLQHSSLWGSQLMSGGAGEGKQLLRPEGSVKNKQEVKTDSTLPAYCNPPNPCPIGYSAEHGCLEEFENSASFSRKYQAAQDCMCDSEHMFDCPNPVVSSGPDNSGIDSFDPLEFNKFLEGAIQMEAKENPFLVGERLPVAAKKGNNVVF